MLRLAVFADAEPRCGVHCTGTLIIRDTDSLSSPEVGRVQAGTPLTVLETRDMAEGSKRARILYERLQRLYGTVTTGVTGWVTMTSSTGVSYLQVPPTHLPPSTNLPVRLQCALPDPPLLSLSRVSCRSCLGASQPAPSRG